ncbi:propanediol utilization protein [Paenibacillus ferrarius]|uniref:Phosphate propanoyltransferase n=1 Tax=Paenibacillus ferrarius TaxID=1469647 RepID=A0A1V4HGY6_9BACL|nr:phosphate propanoyltransferase [Paenibacillus ferrarius]OPH55006.1 propanediol utilization protein [Paenibacillus ferrarius]
MALITETQLRTQLVKGLPNPFPVKEEDKLTPAAADFLKDRGIAVVRIASASSADTIILPVNHMTERKLIPVGVSNRHVHLSPEHINSLFGNGYTLTPLRELSQKGQFAARETLTLLGPRGILQHVRILGPPRGASQVEISRTDGYALGVHPPVRLSGDVQGTPGITLIGASGAVVLQEGLILAKNHVHMSPADAQALEVTQGDRLIVQTLGERPLLFADTIVRVSEQFSLDFHIDVDEANAAFLNTGDQVQLIGRNGTIASAERG